MSDRECYACHEELTEDEWENRHSDSNGEDVHERCCDVCEEIKV